MAGLLLLASAASPRDTRGTILLVEHPDRFILYNKYQQRLTSAEYRSLPTVMPMVVLREQDRLNDGLTPCVSVEFGGSPFFLQREVGGGFSQRAAGGTVTYYRDAALLDDTVALVRGSALRLYPADRTREQTLAPGTQAIRVFSSGGRTFVRLLSGARPAGWVSLAGSSDWKIVREIGTIRASGETARQRLTPLIDEANRVLTVIHTRLAREANLRSTAAAFRLVMESDTLRCTVVPSALSRSYAGSLAAMLPAMERALGGTGLQPTLAGGAIVIPLR